MMYAPVQFKGSSKGPFDGHDVPPASYRAPSRDDEIRLGTVLATLRRRWLLVAGCVTLPVGAAVAYALLATPTYEAAASIRVDDVRGTLPSVSSKMPGGDQVFTEMEVLHSRSLAAAVSDSLGLQLRLTGPRRAIRSRVFASVAVSPDAAGGEYRLVRQGGGQFLLVNTETGAQAGPAGPGQPLRLEGATITLAAAAARHPEITVEVLPREEAVDALREEVLVARAGLQANVLTLRYRDTDPRLVRDVLNAWTAGFMANRQSVQKTEARSTAGFLRAQLDTLSVELASSENALRAFREREQVISPEIEASTQVTRMATLQADRSGIDAERRALGNLLDDIRASEAQQPAGAPSPYRRLIGFPTLLRNQVASELLRSLSGVEDQRTALLTRRLPEDPDVQVLTARVHELEEQLRSIATTYVEGLGSQVAALDGTLAQSGRQLERIPAKEVEFARLQRTPKVLQEMVALLQTRLKEAQIAQAVEDPSVRVVDEAVIPTKPVSPKLPVAIAFGLFVGVVLGGAAVAMREVLDKSVHTRTDVQWVTGVPVLGLIPSFDGVRKGTALAGRAAGRKRLAAGGAAAAGERLPAGPASPARAIAEDSYARLYFNIASLVPEGASTVVVVTSALPGDGKTTSATNLALTLAKQGKRVVLVDADLRRGVIGALFGMPSGLGLTDVLRAAANVEHAMRSIDVEDGGTLHYLTAGSHATQPATLLGSGRMRALVAELKQRFDAIIIDSPPINAVPDAAALAAHADGVLVVARAGITPHGALDYAMEQLRVVRAPVLGAVLNDVDFRRDATYDESYKHYGRNAVYYATSNG